jgi:hypothetical protein
MSGFPAVVHASVFVTEIMYNPIGANIGHQWIEITNTGTDSLDLGAKTIRFFDASGNHLLKAVDAGNTMLPAGVSAVIAQNPLTFKTDYPNYSGILFKSSFTLTASGIVGITQTDGTLLDKVSYDSAQGAKGDGNSLQRSQKNPNAAFVPAAPTPGLYPLTLPAALSSPVKQIATSRSSSRQGKKTKKTSTTVTSKTHGKGIIAPADSADAASAGALTDGDLPAFSFSMPSFAIPSIPLFSSVWFAAFLALLGFSSFSIFVLQKHYNT